MSIATEIRSYVDQAQARGTTLVETARAEAKAKRAEVDSLVEAAVSPLLTKANEYRTVLGDKVEDLLADPRIAKAIEAAAKLSKVVEAKVVAPVKALVESRKPAAAAAPAAPVVETAAAPVATAPAKKAPARKAPAAKATAAKAPARKAPAKKAPVAAG